MNRRELLTVFGHAPLALPLAALAAPAEPGAAVAWPQVSLLDGKPWGADDARASAVVVVFWSTTCPFCRSHNRHIEQLHRAAAGKALRVLGVARERDAATVRRYAAQQGYSFPITTDYPAMAQALSTRNHIPLTVTIDRQGRLKQVIPGEMFEEDVMELLQLADATPARKTGP